MKILSCVALALLLVGCSEEAKTEVKEVKEVKSVQVEKIVEAKAVEVKKVEEKTMVTPQAVIAQKVLAPAPTKEVEKVVASIDAAALFKACSACHGASGEKPALGKSKLIQGWPASQVTHALNGYKDGTYGASMKGIMKGQVSKLNDEQIKALSDYISKL